MNYQFRFEGCDGHGLPIWSCTRPGAGIAGYGPTQKDALEDFLDVEEIVLPRCGRVIHSSPFEPPTVIDDYQECEE